MKSKFVQRPPHSTIAFHFIEINLVSIFYFFSFPFCKFVNEYCSSFIKLYVFLSKKALSEENSMSVTVV